MQQQMSSSQTYKKKKQRNHEQQRQWGHPNPYYSNVSGLSSRNHGHTSQASLSASDITNPSKGRAGSSRFGRRTKRSQVDTPDSTSMQQASFSGAASNSQSSFTRPLSPGMNPYGGGRHPGGMTYGKKFTQMDPTHLSVDQVKMIQMELDRLSLERTQLETEVLLRQKQVQQMEESLESTAQQTALVAYQASQQRQKVVELERALKLKNKQLSLHQQRKADMRPTNFVTVLPIALRKKFSDFLTKVLKQQRPAFEQALSTFMQTKVTDKELPENCSRDQLMREISQINNALIDDYVTELELRLNGTFSAATDPHNDTTNKNTRAQALYTFHTSRTSNVAEHFAAASISKPITPNTPDTNFTFEQGANANDNDNDNDNNNNTNNLNIIDHQRTATQDSMSNTEDSFIIHQQSNNSVFGGIGNNYKTPNNLSVQPSPHLNITDKSEDEISALSKDPENPIEDQTDDDYDDDGSVHMKKEASPGSTKINPVPNAPGGISGQPRGNTLSVQKNGKNRGNSASPGARGVGTRGSAHTSPNNGGHGRGHETSDSDDDEDDEEFNDDPEFNAMQQQMATMWENEIQKVSSGGHGGSDGMQQMLESFMHFNHDLNMERPETAPDMFGVPKELREKPYLEVRDLLEALPYNLSFAILREQEMNYPSDKIKDILIQRGCWPMVRFQTRKGKIISVNLKRTVPFSDVLTKLETYLGLNKGKKVDMKYIGNELLASFDPQHTTGFRLHMITGIIRQRNEAKHEITALNLRVGRLFSVSESSFEMLQNAVDFYQSLDKPSLMLVLGPNTAEKSALIREISRMTANNYNIRTALVDTRSTVGGYTNSPLECGQAVRYYVNSITHQHNVIDETRSIYPQCVIVDEVLSEDDINALQKLQSEGISVVCGTNMATLPALMSHAVFSSLLPPQDRASGYHKQSKHRHDGHGSSTISFMSAHLVILELNYTATTLRVYKNVPAACKAVTKGLSPPCDTYPIDWRSYSRSKHDMAKVVHTSMHGHARSNSRHINKLIKKSYRNLFNE